MVLSTPYENRPVTPAIPADAIGEADRTMSPTRNDQSSPAGADAALDGLHDVINR